MDELKQAVETVKVQEPEPYEARLMKLKGDPGQRKLTTWQRDGKHKRFNAHGCL